jgi:hypothetical protein
MEQVKPISVVIFCIHKSKQEILCYNCKRPISVDEKFIYFKVNKKSESFHLKCFHCNKDCQKGADICIQKEKANQIEEYYEQQCIPNKDVYCCSKCGLPVMPDDLVCWNCNSKL